MKTNCSILAVLLSFVSVISLQAQKVRWLFLFVLMAITIPSLAQEQETNHAVKKFDPAGSGDVPSDKATVPFEVIKARAEKGDAKAESYLGAYYLSGTGAPNAVEAVKWLRKAAEQEEADAQYNLGFCYDNGQGVMRDVAEAARWYRKSAEQGIANAQFRLGVYYENGWGGTKDSTEAVKWYRKAAEQGLANAQHLLGQCYVVGRGVKKDFVEAEKWLRKAADQDFPGSASLLGSCYSIGEGAAKNDAEAAKWYRAAAKEGDLGCKVLLAFCYLQGKGVPKDSVEAAKLFREAAAYGDIAAEAALGDCFINGEGVPKDYVEAYKWWNLASAQGDKVAKTNLSIVERLMTSGQIAEAQRLAQEFKPRDRAELYKTDKESGSFVSRNDAPKSSPAASGTGFFITDDGYLISNYHVVKDAKQVRLVTSAGVIPAKVVKVDEGNDIALLKAEGAFSSLPLTASRNVGLGDSVVTLGFPDPDLQGFAPKLAKGEIASLSGAADDARYFQISVPVQPGNSGGALVNERGNVVGIVSAKLDASAALAASGALPENVNYAVKSSFILSFLESVPKVLANLKEPNTSDGKLSDVIKSAESATVLVLVY
jgi:TPR repeat protein